MAQELSARVMAFLREHISSIEALEVLLLAWRPPRRRWDAEAVAAELRIQPRSAAGRLAALHKAGFASAYLLLGSIFLTIGSMAATVREVQTLSMPVTMLQLLVFFFASYTVATPGSPLEHVATVIPFSSPYAMLARAASDPDLVQHFVALAWQALWIAVIIRLGAQLFRRRVMQSGPSGGKRAKSRPKPA